MFAGLVVCAILPGSLKCLKSRTYGTWLLETCPSHHFPPEMVELKELCHLGTSNDLDHLGWLYSLRNELPSGNLT